MGGGLMQLVAYGAQDIYLTGNPQITFFKVVYRRHTNFAMESIKQSPTGSVAAAQSATYTISRTGDLVGRMYVHMPAGISSKVNQGALNIKEVSVEIGGQQIDKHYGIWLEVWAELTEPNYDATVGTSGSTDGTLFQNMSGMGGSTGSAVNVNSHVPLQFWFNRNPGLALPLIALQYHEVKVIIKWGDISAEVDETSELWADYIYLDTDERRRFAQVSHEYLIEQLQRNAGISSGGALTFNHPVKELVWTKAGATPADLGTSPLDAGDCQLKLNGQDRFAARDTKYFTRAQVYQHHTGCGGLVCSSAGNNKNVDSIAVYSFALKPEEHQPSGTCNFSRIDNAQLTHPNSNPVDVYAVNYNVLRIMSGMGGLAYSN
jgi:hypothetical protein